MKNKQLLAVVCTVHFLLGLDINIIGVSLPLIASHFNITGSEASRIVWVYFLVLTGTLLGFGKLGDYIGFKKIYLSGIGVFTAATILIFFSGNINTLLLFRIFQAIGASVMYALTPAIISAYFPNEQTGKVFGINYVFTALGGVIGRAASGFLIESFGWYSVFAIKIPFGIIALILGIKYLPQVITGLENKKFDFIGTVLVFSGLLTLLYALNTANDFGWNSPVIIASFMAGIFLLLLFVLRELKIDNPLLNLKILKNKNVSYYLIAFIIIYIITNGMIFILPFYLQIFQTFSKQETGLLMTIPSVMQIIFGYISGYFSDRVDHKKIIITGMAFSGLSALALIMIPADNKMIFIPLVLALYGAAIGYMIPSNTNTVMKYAPENEKGSVSSFMITAVRIGSAIGVCLFATLFSFYVPDKNPLNTSVPVSIVQKGFNSAFYSVIILSLFMIIILSLYKKKK